jgi:hypothetical protein
MASNTIAFRSGSQGVPTSAGVKFGSIACPAETFGIAAIIEKADAPIKKSRLSII